MRPDRRLQCRQPPSPVVIEMPVGNIAGMVMRTTPGVGSACLGAYKDGNDR
ncbi:hypothetical protein WKW80_00760 [Variovorax humicola]|uniref:Uncharacterized protein n=1 Tax=Variovorax humicola TaxID=1769758 RepID=A0ABU8VTG9_9BURK